MATVTPFAALRPDPSLAARVRNCELPLRCHVVRRGEGHGRGNPLSFLRVSKPEIDLPEGTDLYSDAVYQKGRENFQKLIADNVLRRDPAPVFHFTGRSWAATARSAGRRSRAARSIWKTSSKSTNSPARTRRTTACATLKPSTPRPVRFSSPTSRAGNRLRWSHHLRRPGDGFHRAGRRAPQLVAGRGCGDIAFLVAKFAKMPALYIADGHHRSAAAGRVYQSRGGAGGSAGFLTVIFPHNQMNILPYNRVLKDLNGRSAGGNPRRARPRV
jgi:hypothetical protein